MGLVYADIELISVDDLAFHRRGYIAEDRIKRVRVSALVDSGSYMLVINEHIKAELDLPVVGEQTVQLADDSLVKVDIVGPVEIRFENRRTSQEALVIPNSSQPLLGVIPLEALDVVIDPKQQRLVVNPESPHIQSTIVKEICQELALQ